MPPHVRMNLEGKLSGYAMRWIIRNHKLALLAFRLPLRNIGDPCCNGRKARSLGRATDARSQFRF